MHSNHARVRVDVDACQRLAALLTSVEIPQDSEEIRVEELEDELFSNLYLLMVSICHQTQELRGRTNGEELRGWDYLSARLVASVTSDHALAKPSTWRELAEADLKKIFRDDDGLDSLSGTAERADLVRDLGRTLVERGWSSLDEIHDSARGRIAVGKPNILESLALARAYGDPVRKKSYFLLGIMRNSGRWLFKDPENLLAPVDYHEVRGHLRLGTVVVEDRALRAQLLSGDQVSESDDIAIRSSVAEALSWLAMQDGLPDSMRLHYLFWNLFRNICLRHEPYCNFVPPGGTSGLPDRYSHLLRLHGPPGRCPFSQICASASSPHKLLEHRYSTHWY